ncbi:GntR family transcriptional regulator [Terrarubrum flagellatum]|uniref:GntR family transcriptional regulator n=1 Tax=Terrirubrum flagellatum TaxID=2895980 RepID=UPI003145688F
MMSIRRRKTNTGYAPADNGGELRPLQPQTLVDLVIDAIVPAAAAGAILPGDRIVEADLARKLGVSRVPVREALRLLESQGIVINEPYRGIRLRPVTNERVDELIEARVALEASATERAVRGKRNKGSHLDPLRAAVREMDLMAARGDAYGLAAADTDFHRALCRLGGNSVTIELWETLARQFTIIFGLATLGKPMPAIVDEHRELLAVIETGRSAAIRKTLDEHITVMNHAVDYEAIIQKRRAERDGK